MEYEIKCRTWTCHRGHINSVTNKECPLCKEEEVKERTRIHNLLTKKKYNYHKKK